jgi:MFS family permease
LLVGGRIGDLFGRKWTFIGGAVGFAIASAVGGAAQSFGMLIAARTAQGVFAAILAPSALALLTTTFAEGEERNKAFGVFAAIASSGAALGAGSAKPRVILAAAGTRPRDRHSAGLLPKEQVQVVRERYRLWVLKTVSWSLTWCLVLDEGWSG